MTTILVSTAIVFTIIFLYYLTRDLMSMRRRRQRIDRALGNNEDFRASHVIYCAGCSGAYAEDKEHGQIMYTIGAETYIFQTENITGSEVRIESDAVPEKAVEKLKELNALINSTKPNDSKCRIKRRLHNLLGEISRVSVVIKLKNNSREELNIDTYREHIVTRGEDCGMKRRNIILCKVGLIRACRINRRVNALTRQQKPHGRMD